MAKVTAQVLGGSPRVVEGVSKVSELKTELGLSGSYVATINGQAAAEDSVLQDYNYVTFAPATKGGR